MAAGPRRLEWSAGARSDLLAIDAWYAQFGEATAERVIDSIVSAANGLSQYPFSGPKGIRPGTRHKVARLLPAHAARGASGVSSAADREAPEPMSGRWKIAVNTPPKR